MKNEEIIARAAIQAGLLTEEEAKYFLDTGEEIPLHTVQGWKLRGDYRVRDGEIPIEVRLWKKKEGGGFYLAKAGLYSQEQMILNCEKSS